MVSRPALYRDIYLDRYFRDPNALLLALNAQIAALNTPSHTMKKL